MAEQPNSNRKAELLSRVVEHIDITSFDARPIIDAMDKMSFSSRDTARAAEIYNAMLEDKDCTVILTLAGSTSAGGCMDAYAKMVELGMVDAIVATGASIVDMDFFEGLGFKHYQAREIDRDEELRDMYIDRIYDTYIDEEDLQRVDHTIGDIADGMPIDPQKGGAMSSRAFIRAMGKQLVESGKKDNSLVKLAYEKDVPIFCPAFSDSSAGFGLVRHQMDRIKAGEPYVAIDSVADFRELTEIKIKAGATGLLMVGGGVPKNFARTRSCARKSSATKMWKCTNTPFKSPWPTCATGRVRRRPLKRPAPGARFHRPRTDGVRRSDHRPAFDRIRRLSPRPLESARTEALARIFRD